VGRRDLIIELGPHLGMLARVTPDGRDRLGESAPKRPVRPTGRPAVAVQDEMTTEPEQELAAAKSEGGSPAGYRWLVVSGLILCLGLSFAGFTLIQGNAPQPALDMTFIVLPVLIAALILVSRRAGPRYLVLAVLLLDLETLFVSVLFAVGLAYAVLLPLIGLAALIDSIRGRFLAAAMVGTGLTSFVGVTIALLYGPASQAAGLNPPIVALAGSALFISAGLGYLYRLNVRRTQALERAGAELASRREAEGQLARASNLLAAIVSSSPVATQVFGPDGTVMVWNPASERVFGWTSQEVVGSGFPPGMIPEDERAPSADRDRRTLAGEVVQGKRVRRITKDGRELWVDLYAAPLRDQAGTPLGVATQLIDVTERVALEARLRQTAKMEAVGVLAGGIAHDFNNILTAIRGYAELVHGGLPAERENDRADLAEVISAADRATALTGQLLAFARKNVREPRVLDPAAVVASFVPMLQRLLGEDVQLTLRLAPETGRIKADPIQLEQVILNLAVNARDAMPAGGQLEIATGNVTLGPDSLEGHPGTRPGQYVRLAVSDTGIGMDDETLGHIFEPFFTTKEPGRGTGMGLATVFGILRMSEGWIDVKSSPGRGSSFSLYFPLEQDDSAVEAAPAPVAGVPRGHETILMVEDDPAVRNFGRRCLTDLGYTVLEAVNGADALALAAAYSGSIDLLVSDVMLPGLQGPEISRRLQALRPGTRTLFCSGFPGGLAETDDNIAAGAYLSKPYTRESLGQAVRAALGASDQPAARSV
jgi:PAS domain S-box-containing protein